MSSIRPVRCNPILEAPHRKSKSSVSYFTTLAEYIDLPPIDVPMVRLQELVIRLGIGKLNRIELRSDGNIARYFVEQRVLAKPDPDCREIQAG